MFFLSYWLTVEERIKVIYKQRLLFWYHLQPIMMRIEDVPKIPWIYWILTQVFTQMYVRNTFLKITGVMVVWNKW